MSYRNLYFIPILALGIACSPPAAEAEPTKTKLSQPNLATVTFHTPSGDIQVKSEVARTPDARRQGLMYRKSLKPHHGMVFVFPREDPQSFWMKNTYLSLDMIFINSALDVVGVVARAEPETLTPRGVSTPSRYVVEVIGGYAKQYGIEKGVRVSFADLGEHTP